MSLQSLNNQIAQVESKLYTIEQKGRRFSSSWKILNLQRELLFETRFGMEFKDLLDSGIFSTETQKELANKCLEQFRKNYKNIKKQIENS